MCDEQVNSVALPGAGAPTSVALRRPARSYAPGEYDPGRRGDPHMKQPSGDDPRAVGKPTSRLSSVGYSDSTIWVR
jgi:hypothetical protein